MQKTLLLFTCLVFYSTVSSSQQITTATGSTVDQLVRQALGNDCVQILNVQSNKNGSVDGLASFGSFNRAASNFPFANGFLLTTGNAVSAGNGFIGPNLNEGTSAWTGDTDLENALGITNTLNATVIEFDLISVTNQISFNYLMASEEYQLDFPCNVSDGFALLIRPAGTNAPYQNLAIIPGTNTPVGIDTVHPEVVGQCPAENVNFFEGTNIGHTNYQGRTFPFTATATVQPNVAYHLKLVVADQLDFRADTAIFIESGSLTANVDLGPDQNPCINTMLNGDVGNALAQYAWYFNGRLLPAETSSTLLANTTGNYRVDVTIPNGATSCTISDEVIILIDPNQLSLSLANLFACDDLSNDGIAQFDLAAQRNVVLSNQPAGNYDLSFYNTNADAIAEINQLPDMVTNTTNGQTVYARLNDLDSGCFGINTFELRVNAQPVAMDATFNACDTDQNGITAIDTALINPLVSSSSLPLEFTYYNSQANATAGVNPFTTVFNNTTNMQTIYARVTDPATGCFDTSTVVLNIIPAPILSETVTYIDACDQDYDGFAVFNLTTVENQFTAGLTGVTVSYHLTLTDANSAINPIANPSSFPNTIAQVQPVFIRVENTSGCASMGRINLYTNYLLDATAIDDFETCDDPSNDGFEPFDLSQMEIDILNGAQDIEIYFYLTEPDQLADVNRLDETQNITNTTNPQTLWIRLESPTCTELAQIELIVVPYFAAQPAPDQTYCDEDQDQLTNVILNTFDDAVRGSLPADLPVRYYLTEQDAIDGTNAITVFNNTSPTFTVWAQTANALGCVDQHPLNITVLPAPVATNPAPIIICDNDADGFSTLDLTAQQAQINTEANRTITYHNSFMDASDHANAIVNTTSYNAQTETIFVRVANTTTGCFNIATQAIIVNTLPVFTAITLYNLCETDGDRVEPFFFNTKTNEILNGQTGKTVSYYENATNALNATNPINPAVGYLNTSSPQTIYVRVENISDPTCYGTSSFQIEVNDAPTYNTPLDLERCDDNNDGISTFNLQNVANQIRTGVTNNLQVSFYISTVDADAAQNELPLTYTNVTNPQTLIARIGNDQLCYELEPFTLNVVDAPVVTTVAASQVCDDDYDGLGVFDLRFRESEIVGTRPFNSVITWHTDIIDANAGTNAITDTQNFNNTANPQTVYLRVFNTVSQCYSLSPLELQVLLPPVFTEVNTFLFCDNDRNEIDLNVINSSLIDPLPGSVSINYYATLSDAQNQINELATPYNYTANQTTIFARMASSVTGCFFVTDLDLVIQQPPVLPALGTYDLAFCDDDYDGILTVDLSQNRSQVLSLVNAGTHTLSYHDSQQDALDNVNPITAPVAVTNNTRFFVNVTDTALGCTSIGSFNVIINELPLSPLTDFYVICDAYIDIDASTGDSSDTYLWSTGETTPQIRINTRGNYSVVITNSTGCSSPQARFLVEQSSTAIIEFIATVNFEDPNSITVRVNGIGDYLYILDNGTPQRSNVFPDVTRGYHDVQVIDINGCAPTPAQRVLIIDYPKFFTPNSDGFNDYWQVDDIETFDEATFYIHDRFGKLLKSFDKFSQGWDGMYNGNPMPSSDYWFTIEIKDTRGDFNVKGHFSLKR